MIKLSLNDVKTILILPQNVHSVLLQKMVHHSKDIYNDFDPVTLKYIPYQDPIKIAWMPQINLYI